MKRGNSTNTFQDGMIMDLNPMATPNTYLTNALNATLLTYNGNENVLQNDMGNGRVETAFLPEGFIPVGTCQFGGIIYIASYNPFTNQSQLGSFPSPERNITSDELCTTQKEINKSNFYISDDTVGNPRYKLILLDDRELSPGDKFQIGSEQIQTFKNKLSAFDSPINNINSYPRDLKLHVISIDSNGTITYLDNDLVWYEDNGKYYIRSAKLESANKTDLDEYRNVVTANYSVYTAKTKGKIGILAELEAITSFDVSWKATVTDDTSSISTFAVGGDLGPILPGGGDSSSEESENLNKVASIVLNVNWTYDNLNKYARNQVNPIGCKVEYDENVTELKEITLGTYPATKSNYVENNYYLVDNNVKSISATNAEELYTLLDNQNLIRRNDGSDPDYSLEPIKKSYVAKSMLNDNDSSGENILTLLVTPAMKFGYLGYLAREITINLDKLGTGEIDLKGYKYYVNQNDVSLNWSLDAYPEEGKEIKYVSFNFYELNKTIATKVGSNWDYFDSYKKTKTNLFEGTDPSCPPYKISNKSSYSGSFIDTIQFDSFFEKNKCYLVQIEINYGTDDKTISYYYYRILYTVPIFNKHYFNTSYSDFCECILDKDLFYYDVYFDTAQYIVDSKTNYRYENNKGETKRFSLDNTFVEKAKEGEEQEQYNNTRQEDYIRITANRSYVLKPINYSGFNSENLFTAFEFKPEYYSKTFYGLISQGSNSTQMSLDITSTKLDEVNVVSPIEDTTSEETSDLSSEIMPIAVSPGMGEGGIGSRPDITKPTTPDIFTPETGGGGGSSSGGSYPPGGTSSGTSSGSKFDDGKDDEKPIDYKPCTLQLAIGIPEGNTFNTSNELISLYIKEADLLINSPFLANYLLDNIMISYSLEKLVEESTIRQLTITPQDKSDIWLRYSGVEIAHVTDQQYVNVDLQGSPVLRSNFVDSAFSSSDFGTFNIFHDYQKCDQPEYIVITDGGTRKTTKDGDIGKNVKEQSVVMISGILIKGIDSQLFVYGATSLQNELRNRYKWVEANNSVQLYKINNLIWWNSYTISIPFSLSETITPEIDTFWINNTDIKIGSGIPRNFQIESIPSLDNLELTIKYDINTDKLKQLLNVSSIYFYNPFKPESPISQNQSASTILVEDGGEYIPAKDLKIGVAEYKLTCREGKLRIQQTKPPGTSGIGSFYYMIEADHMKDKDWKNGETNKGEILRLSNLLIG